MRIRGNLILPDGIRRGVIEFSEYIEGIYEKGTADIDFGDAYIGPGFIDVHFHGAVGESFNECNTKNLHKILDYCISHGTTSCLAGITTDTMQAMNDAVVRTAAYIKSAQNRSGMTAELLGIHMEGPFLNPDRCGGMEPSLIIPASLNIFKEWEKSDVVKMITLAPELSDCAGLMKYIREQGGCVISAGHTDADFEQLQDAVKSGVTHITHFFNAMSGMHHRRPGAAGAGLFSDVTVELITDDIHVHPVMCKLVFKMKSPEQVCLVTDSVAAAGLPDGEHEVGGRKVLTRNGQITLESGVLAGSAHTMDQAVKNTARFVSVKDAWTMASWTPAKELGMLRERGSLKAGNIADFAVLDSELVPKATFVRGNQVWESPEVRYGI